MTRFGTQEPFLVLVANLTGQYDSNKNPIKARTGFRLQHLLDDSGCVTLVNCSGAPTRSSAQVTITDDDFSTGEAMLVLGEFLLETNLHWTPTTGDAVTSAADLALAIDALPGVNATSLGAVVTILGVMGPSGQTWPLSASYTGSKVNYTLSPANGYFLGGNPAIGAVDSILP